MKIKWKDMNKKQKKNFAFHIFEYLVYLGIMFSGLSVLVVDFYTQQQGFQPIWKTDPDLFLTAIIITLFGLVLMKLSDISYNIEKRDD